MCGIAGIIGKNIGKYTQIQKYLDYTYKHWCLLVLEIWFDKVYTKNSL